MRQCTRWIFVSCFLLSLCTAKLTGQSVVRGLVIDKENRQPIDVATIQLIRGKNALALNYTLTDNKGAFTLPLPQPMDSLTVSVSLLGYKTIRQTIRSGQYVVVEMEPQLFHLKEVEIHPGRVWGRQDTIHYDVTRFLSPKDRAIKDVLRKLPGIDIDDLGKISYNGKEISHFYIEGLDLTHGKYKQISDNLRAEAVQKVQIMENHQPIRILQKKIKTEDIALNLQLKPEFRDRWLLSGEGAIGTLPLLWKGGIDALQIGRRSQSAYLYKGNNIGQDVSEDQNLLTKVPEFNLPEPIAPAFLNQIPHSAPLKKERWLFNRIHSLSINRLHKLDEDTQLRINAGFIHDLQTQERGSETTYYQTNDTVQISERSESQVRSDRTDLQIGLENNSQERYLKNQFSATGDWQSGLTHISGNALISGKASLEQRIKTPTFVAQNRFHGLWNRDSYTMEAQSLLRYNGQSAKLCLDHETSPMDLKDFYTDNALTFLKKRGSLTQRYTAGIIGEISTIENNLQTYFSPDYQWTGYKWTLSLSIPFKWTGYTGADFSRLSLDPTLSAIYKLNYAWRFSGHASYKERYGDMTDLYARPYRINYRNTIWNNGTLPVYRQQLYSVYGEYKNTAREFFITLHLTHMYDKSNLIDEQRIQEGQIQRVSLALSAHGSGWSARSTVSKGFYDWGLKTSLETCFGINKSEQMSEGQRLPYQSCFMRYEPKVIWTPDRHWETSYQASFQYGGTKIGTQTRLTPLWNSIQQFRLSYLFSPFEANLYLDHYHNDVNAEKSVDALFADLSIGWKSKRWQLTAIATNLFDKRTYGYSQYTALERYTSWIQIRPREFIISLRLMI